MKEIWKDVKGYEGSYQVSNLGNVKSLDRIITHRNGRKFNVKGKMLTPKKHTGGYSQVCLSKRNYRYIHRLVAEVFIPNPENLPEVNHKDENKKNNHAENLEWCTSKYNTNYGTCIQRMVSNMDYSKTTIAAHNANKKPVLQFDKNGNFIKKWDCASDAERYLRNKITGFICKCCKGEHKFAYGFVWKYAD